MNSLMIGTWLSKAKQMEIYVEYTMDRLIPYTVTTDDGDNEVRFMFACEDEYYKIPKIPSYMIQNAIDSGEETMESICAKYRLSLDQKTSKAGRVYKSPEFVEINHEK